jgi:MOSC domain-containing protein YiiM
MKPVGKLEGIATKPVRRQPMKELLAAHISTEHGVESDARGAPGRRQVTVLTRSGWEAACKEAGAGHLDWTARRANLFIANIDLKGKIGYDLRLGDAVLTISGETRPCKVMDQAHPRLKVALQPDWRGGVTCWVRRSGNVTVGSEVVLSRHIFRQPLVAVHQHARRFKKRGREILVGFARRLGWNKARIGMSGTDEHG